jgi:hypothetical protein
MDFEFMSVIGNCFEAGDHVEITKLCCAVLTSSEITALSHRTSNSHYH